MIDAAVSRLKITSRLWVLGCIGAFGAVILAGFWPFKVPRNEVEWVPGENGLRFGGHGIVLSGPSFNLPALSQDVTLEIYLSARDLSGAGTILAFDDAPNPSYVFAVRQVGTGLAIQRPAFSSQGKLIRYWWSTGQIFRKMGPVVLTIASAQNKATLYMNGVPVSESWDHGQLSTAMTGKMILGSSAVREGWTGEIKRLAIYNALLSQKEIERHSNLWLHAQNPSEESGTIPLALYSFNEKTGHAVHDATADPNLQLNIPERYRIGHREFLTPFWVPLRDGWDSWRNWVYWSDLLINVIGFVPFGFFFAGWFSRRRRISRPLLVALCFGIGLSFAIECTQYFLPTRDSSMTDLLTNSLGTAIGVVLFRKGQLLGWISKKDLCHNHSI